MPSWSLDRSLGSGDVSSVPGLTRQPGVNVSVTFYRRKQRFFEQQETKSRRIGLPSCFWVGGLFFLRRGSIPSRFPAKRKPDPHPSSFPSFPSVQILLVFFCKKRPPSRKPTRTASPRTTCPRIKTRTEIRSSSAFVSFVSFCSISLGYLL